MSLYQDVIIAGFGGQGVMLIGNLFAYAGMNAGLSATYIPVYGPEMRGGTANCAVVLSDEPIASPIVTQPNELIAMNGPSLLRFEPMMEPGGLLLINSSQVENPVYRKEMRCYLVPCMEEAGKLGNYRVANMIMLGFAWQKGLLPLSAAALI